MTAEPDYRQRDDEDPLETTELARRLRRMQWPPAPPEVRKRVLDRIIERSWEEFGRDGERTPDAPDVG
jgi:hypothetical protein